jgi:hypothetical protein
MTINTLQKYRGIGRCHGSVRLHSKRNDIILGLMIFLLNLALAIYEKWSATDLIWGLWIASLTLGYAYILVAILGMFIRGEQPGLSRSVAKKVEIGQPVVGLNIFLLLALLFITGLSRITILFFLLVILSLLFALNKEIKEKYGLTFLPDNQHIISRFFINLPSAIFMLAFFSFHFIFFHFIHSIFLSGFFLILGSSPFDNNPGDLSVYFLSLVKFNLHRFWIFIALSAVSRLGFYLKAFKSGAGHAMFVPYKNVVRMHVTIFVLAFLSYAALGDYVLYFVFVLYFLPVRSIFKLFQKPELNRKVSGSLVE